MCQESWLHLSFLFYCSWTKYCLTKLYTYNLPDHLQVFWLIMIGSWMELPFFFLKCTSSWSLSLSIRSISGWHNKISLLIKCVNECEWTWTIHSLSSPVPRCLVYPYKIKSDLLQRIHLLLYSYTNQLVIMVGFVILLRLKVLGKRKSWAVPNHPFLFIFLIL